MIINVKIDEFLENIKGIPLNKLLVITILTLALTIMMSLVVIVLILS